MAATMATTTEKLPTPLMRYLRVQALLDQQIIGILQRAYAAANSQLKQLEGDESVGREIRARQIRVSQAEIKRELAVVWSRVGDVVRADRARAAAAAIDALFDPLVPLLQSAGFTDQRVQAMLRSQRATAERGVTNAMTRVSLTKIPLSSQVYRSRVLVNGQLDRIITSAIARGVSAKELADAVRPFIRPDTPGGVRYAALRLGRTELNNAFHGTQIQSAIDSPFVTAMRWQLSGSHPEPDECNDYAEGGDLGGGLWTPENVPAKPHPNCLCFCEPQTPSREEFLRRFRSGEYTQWIDQQDVA